MPGKTSLMSYLIFPRGSVFGQEPPEKGVYLLLRVLRARSCEGQTGEFVEAVSLVLRKIEIEAVD